MQNEKKNSPVQSGPGVVNPDGFKRELSFFDVTNIVVGSIVGSDIYVASALTAGLIGPFSIVVWVVAAVAAAILALVFAYCSYYVPRVGGAFAFVSAAFDDFYGFLAGWSMWIAEVLSLPVFAITFTNYLQYFVPLNIPLQLLVKFIFIFGLTYSNIRGVKAAGRINDILTFIKLLPLFLLVIVGLVSIGLNPGLLSNYSPFLPYGLNNFGTSLVIIFWAYAGFELAPLPADEVKDPGRTIPRAIVAGMAIVTLFYLSTNFVIYGMVNTAELARTMTPLLLVGAALLGTWGGAIMSGGALVSVSGSNESGILGTARLSYAMAIDGLFPKIFAVIHRRYGTPYLALIIQGIIAFALSIFSAIPGLISFAVFNLAFTYLFTCMALIDLKDPSKKLPGQNIIPLAGIFVCIYLLFSTSVFNILTGFFVILLGIPVYIYFSPKTDFRNLKNLFISEQAVMLRAMEKQNNFLAHAIRHLHELIIKRNQKAT